MNNIKEKLKVFFSNRKNRYITIGVLVVLILVIVLLLVGGGTKAFQYFFKTGDSVKFSDEYESLNNQIAEGDKKYPKVVLPDNDLIKYASLDEILNIFDTNGDAVIYFGYSTCYYCRNAVQVLLDTAVDTDIDEIYYLDIEDVWDKKVVNDNNEVVNEKEAVNGYDKLLEVLGDELVSSYIISDKDGNDVDTNEMRVDVPLVIFVANGSVVSYNKGTLFSQEDPFVELDASQVEGLSMIYRYGINDVIESKKNKNLAG